MSPFVLSQGVGRRYAHVVLRKADIDLTKRAGELTEEEVRIQMEFTHIWKSCPTSSNCQVGQGAWGKGTY